MLCCFVFILHPALFSPELEQGRKEDRNVFTGLTDVMVLNSQQSLRFPSDSRGKKRGPIPPADLQEKKNKQTKNIPALASADLRGSEWMRPAGWKIVVNLRPTNAKAAQRF